NRNGATADCHDGGGKERRVPDVAASRISLTDSSRKKGDSRTTAWGYPILDLTGHTVLAQAPGTARRTIPTPGRSTASRSGLIPSLLPASAQYSRPQPPTTDSTSVVVYLGTLKRTRIIHVTNLRLRIELVHLPPSFAMPVPRLLNSAERHVGFRTDGGRVYVRNPVVQPLQRAERQVYIAGIQRRRQPVLHPVVHLECLRRIVHTNHGENRTKDLLLLDPRARLHPREDRRQVEEAAIQRFVVRARTTDQEVRTLALPDVNITLHLGSCGLVHQWTHIRLLLAAIAELQIAYA